MDKARAAVASAISAAAKIAGNLAVFLEAGQVHVKQVAVPERPPNFALLQLIVAGICNTDLELQRGYYNFSGTPGHEFVAHVLACDNPDLQGRRVVGEINLACGACDFCLTNLGCHCRNRSVLGILRHPGAFSEYFTLPEANLRIVPDNVSNDEAVFVEPLAAACEILDQVALAPGTEVAVLGGGKLGQLITQVLLAHQLRVTVYGRHDSKPQATYSCVVECTGSAQGLTTAIQMTKARGTVVMKSTIHEKIELDTAAVIVNELTLLGSRCGRFEPALQLLETHRVNVTPLIAARFPLAEAEKAFAKAATRGTLKVLLSR